MVLGFQYVDGNDAHIKRTCHMDSLRKVIRNMWRRKRNHNMMITSLRNSRMNFLGKCESITDQTDDVGLENVQS